MVRVARDAIKIVLMSVLRYGCFVIIETEYLTTYLNRQ